MENVKAFLNSAPWLILSNLALIYALSQILITKWVIRKHNKLMEYYPRKISGGDTESHDKSNEAIHYSKTKKYKRIELLKKVF